MAEADSAPEVAETPAGPLPPEESVVDVLRVRDMYGTALAVWRRHWARVTGVALVVLVPFGMIENLLHPFAHTLEVRGAAWAGIVLILLASLLATVGEIFFAGVLEETVGKHLHGRRLASLRQVARDLPYIPLFAANLAVTLVVAAGTVALLVPGFIAFVQLSIVGPLVNIERCGFRAGMQRSAQLVRPHFWLVAAVVVPPTFAELVVDTWYEEFAKHSSWLQVLGVLAALSVTFGVFIALIEVTVAHRLRDRDLAQRVAIPEPRAK